MGDYLDGLDLPLSDSGEEREEDDDADAAPEQAFFEFRAVQVKKGSNGNAAARFVYTASDLPGKELAQWLYLPVPAPEEPLQMNAFSRGLFHIGLVLLLWPWMHFGHRLLKIRAGTLDDRQVKWWQWFYRGILAEWAVVNGRGLHDVELEIAAAAHSDTCGARVAGAGLGDAGAGKPVKPAARQLLCPLGGGKDSLVVFELLRNQADSAVSWLYVSDGVGEFERSSRLRGIVARSGVPCHVFEHDFGGRQVADLRARVHLGQGPRPAGHPWAALVSFDAALASVMLGFDTIAVGNEHSANYGNGIFLEGDSGERLEVNHQFDKSLEFERAFHVYAREHMAPGVHYFSPLQNLWELQIAHIFVSHLHPYLDLFISCNNSGGNRSWCLACEKCCFVFAMFAAFLDSGHVTRIFGKNLFIDVSLLPRFRELIGGRSGRDGGSAATVQKPFECIGEPAEALLALALARARCCRADAAPGQRSGRSSSSVPVCLERLGSALDHCSATQAQLLLGRGLEAEGPPGEGCNLLPAWWRWPPSVLESLAAAGLECEELLSGSGRREQSDDQRCNMDSGVEPHISEGG